MPTTITMPQLGETVTEGTVSQWLKRVGDTVEKYEPFVEVSTDKVNAEIPSPVSGTIRELIVKEGQTVPTGAPIAIIEETGVATEALTPTSNGHAANGQRPAESGATARGISPAVRRLAREHAVDLTRVNGTGTNGRVTANDVIGAARGRSVETITTPPPAPIERTAPLSAATETVVFSQARRLIAQRMVESKHTAPHAWTMVETDVSELWKWRATTKEAFAREHGVALTLLPFFIHAVVKAIARYPFVNASWRDDGIIVHKEINVGIAVATDENLYVPVIRRADQLSIKGIAFAAAELIGKCRRGTISADDLGGGTITVNNTGVNGSVLSAPILVPGQTAIVTMEAVVKRPIVTPDDAIAIRSMMNVCLSLDHRVIDGAIASGFLVEIKRRLEAMGPAGTL